MVEEVVVEAVETPFRIVGEDAVLISVLRGDAGMVVPLLIRILDEENVIDNAEQGVFQLVVFLVFLLAGEIELDFLLGVDEILQTITSLM